MGTPPTLATALLVPLPGSWGGSARLPAQVSGLLSAPTHVPSVPSCHCCTLCVYVSPFTPHPPTLQGPSFGRMEKLGPWDGPEIQGSGQTSSGMATDRVYLSISRTLTAVAYGMFGDVQRYF